ncbi:MAG: hypothetical protein KIT68_03820 [Phycisphaeraceae bacterium]|nr:hypothetical protein [Phycisphaeraceae bacterium]
MPPVRPAHWAAELRRIAAPVLDPLPPLSASTIAAFRDDSGHARPADPWFLAHRARRCGVALSPASIPQPPPDAPPDVALWAAIALDLPPPIAFDERGPLFAQGDTALEVYTESLLSAMHALHWLARRDRDGRLLARNWLAARWFAEHLQPDNATNHPWAVHVFFAAAWHGVSSACRPLAETLLHNCQVALGRPDRLSAHILADAAEALADSDD